MSNKNRFVWLNDEIVRINDAKINVLAPTSQFGVNVFEGIRCYWNDKKLDLYAFRLEDHYNRLMNSIKLFKLNSKYTKEDFKKALIDVVKKNKYKEDIAVRQTVFVNGFGTWHSKGPTGMFVAPIPKKRTVANKSYLKVQVSTFRRINDNTISPRVKVGANYINSRMAHLEATDNGYDTAIILNKEGYVSEGPGSCIFILKDKKLITPSLASSILESITRDTLIKIAKKDMGIEVEERFVNRTELYTADEVFLCGSAMELRNIANIDGYNIGDGKNYKISEKLHENYIKVVSGQLEGYEEWLTKIN